MSCSCDFCKNIISVSSVTTSGGITTVNVPTGTIFEDCTSYCLGLFLTIPAGTNGTQINITDGTTTYTVFNKVANYWRPKCGLRSRSVLKVKFLDDPAHFIIA